jgi:hypothetical protein
MDGGQTWETLQVGKSSNRIFVTGGSASGTYETVQFVGCNGGEGLSPAEADDPNANHAATVNQTLADTIFNKEFRPRSLRGAEGDTLTYWGQYTKQTAAIIAADSGIVLVADNPYHLDCLMKHHDGTCDAWAQFLVSVFSAEGLSSSTLTVTPAVPNASHNPAPDSFVIYPALPAQNNPSPLAFFKDHAVVKFGNNTIFDPSYGLEFNAATLAISESEWEKSCIYAIKLQNGSTVLLTQLPGFPNGLGWWKPGDLSWVKFQ